MGSFPNNEYIYIRIKKSDMSVAITDENGNDIPDADGQGIDIPLNLWTIGDFAAWWQHNPTCVWQGGRLKCG